MRDEQRGMEQRRLDEMLRYFRLARKHKLYHSGWLRTVRQALGIPMAELAKKLGVNSSVIFRMEQREAKRKVSLMTLERMAEAMGCELVYAIVPRWGKTLVELAEYRAWEKRFDKRKGRG